MECGKEILEKCNGAVMHVEGPQNLVTIYLKQKVGPLRNADMFGYRCQVGEDVTINHS